MPRHTKDAKLGQMSDTLENWSRIQCDPKKWYKWGEIYVNHTYLKTYNRNNLIYLRRKTCFRER